MMLQVNLTHKSIDWASKVQTTEFTIKGDYIVKFFGENKLIKSFGGELFSRLDFGSAVEVLYMDCEANDIEDKNILELLESIYKTYLEN